MDSHIQDQFRAQADEAQHQKPITDRTAWLIVISLLVVAIIVALSGIFPRMHAKRVLAKETQASAAVDVIAQPPQKGSPILDVVLPGNVYAYTESPIFAHTDGYLAKWYYDIGAHVRKGALLATISDPELDQQVEQARADVQTASTNAGIASITAARYQDLLPSSAVSKQETDTAASQAQSGKSGVNSAQANLQRLLSLQGYETVYAPFDGIGTARNVDLGQLINSGANGGAASQLFHMAAVNTLRVYVAVPQAYIGSLKPGAQTAMAFNEFPGKSFPVKLVRSSGYVDPTSRTLLVELEYDNRKGDLTPGSFAQVHFRLKAAADTVIVPASALMFRTEGLRVGTVITNSSGATVAKLVPIILGQDDGKVVQVVSGLTAQDRVIQDPPDSLVDGEPLDVVAPRSADASGKGSR